MRSVTIYNEDCLVAMRLMQENSVDAIVTDPPYGLAFMGSGSTGVAALKEGFNFVGIEREAEYYEIAMARLKHEKASTNE